MKARAPGKIVLTGAYAVLHGAPALVVAVDRHAVADSEQINRVPSPELELAFDGQPAPAVDTRALYEGGCKLGLGSSAAVVVAALASTLEPAVLASAAGRRQLFQRARAAHASAQQGGSGVDVAASTYGGLLEYRMDADEPLRRCWPRDLLLEVYFSGHSAKTSSLLGQVRALAERDPRRHDAVQRALGEASAAAACALDSAAELIAAAQRFARALAALGAAAGAPIVTPAFAALAASAEREEAAFFGAGAGGGDVAVRLGRAPASVAFRAQVAALGLRPLSLQRDEQGAVHVPSST